MTQSDGTRLAFQTIAVIIYVGALIMTGQSIRTSVARMRTRCQPWPDRLRGLGSFCGKIELEAFLIILLISMIDPANQGPAILVGGSLIVGTMGLHAAADLTAKLTEAHDHPGMIGAPLKRFLGHVWAARRAEFQLAAVLLKQRLLPRGFLDLHPAKLTTLPFKGDYRALGMLYLGGALMTAVVLLSAFGSSQGALTQVVRTWAVFWVLMVAVSMTPSFVLAWLAMKYASATGAIECKITLHASLTIMANWVSIGGVIGLLTGAVSFVPMRYVASSGLGQEPISLSILADLSLAGAVGGFLASHFAVVFACTASMENRLAARALPAVTISAFTSLASFTGINPAANAAYSLGLIRKVAAVPADLGSLDMLAKEDWKIVLAMTEESMRGAFPDATAFAIGVAGATTLIAMVSLGKYVSSSVTTASAEIRQRASAGRNHG